MAYLRYVDEEHNQDIIIQVSSDNDIYEVVEEGIFPLLVAVGYSPISVARGLAMEDLLEVFSDYDKESNE